jgi:outer membrane protein
MHHHFARHAVVGATLPLLAALLPSPGMAQTPTGTPSGTQGVAKSSCKTPSPECVVVGEWDISVSLGAGTRTNPIRGKSNIPLVVIPQISYYGKRFFLESLDLGYTLYDGAANTFNLVGTPGYDRAFFYSGDLQNIFVTGATQFTTTPIEPGAEPREFPVSPRHTTYLAGPEWTFSHGPLVGQLDLLYEVTGRHKGYEVRTAVAAPIIQAKSSLVASAGLTWKSAEVVRYYYGVKDLYEPGSAVNPFLKLGYSLPLSDRWALTAFAHYEFLDDAVGDSPIVEERHVATVFAGVVFKLL